MADWLTAGDVLAWAGAHVTVAPTDPAVAFAVAGAAAYVERECPAFVYAADGSPAPKEDQPGDVMAGAVMLAWRLIERRGTALGTAGLGPDFGGAAQIMRSDPDIARLLQVGPFAPFDFGAPSPVVNPDA